MPIPFDQILLRYLRQMHSFTEVAEGLPLSTFVAGQPEGEKVLGWYRNPAPFEQSVVVFTDEALYLIEPHTVRIAWGEIEAWELERPASRTDVGAVKIRTKSGTHLVRSGDSHEKALRCMEAMALIAVLSAGHDCHGAEKARAK